MPKGTLCPHLLHIISLFRDVPHFGQNFIFSSISALHSVHLTFGGAAGFPQSGQNLEPAGILKPQEAQSITSVFKACCGCEGVGAPPFKASAIIEPRVTPAPRPIPALAKFPPGF